MSACVNCGSAWCPAHGCATYNPTELRHVPHYPSTADLAAFRRSIRDTHPVPAITDPAYHDGNFFGQAWPHETAHGIGWQDGTHARPRTHWDGIDARREASRMRSEAFAARGRQYEAWLYTSPPAGPMPFPQRTAFHTTSGGAWKFEAVYGCPGWRPTR